MYKQLSKISVIGSGYIGLVVGACLADFGNNVICADIDLNKIDKLKKGEIPIYEPGMEELVQKNIANNLLNFTSNVDKTIQDSDIIFIAVNTPTNSDGRSDISAVLSVARVIAKNLNSNKIICIKSTVPVGTYKKVESIIKEHKKTDFDFSVVSIPEFLREGSAINDFLNPDRIIIGTESEGAYLAIKQIFSKINCKPECIVWTNNLSAETIKYVSNSFLALKVSFINEIANFCDEVGVDAISVAQGVGLDKRIGPLFLKPGPGFGGSCFPKDVQALITMAQDYNVELETIKAAMTINDQQQKRVVQKLSKLLVNDLNNKVIAVLGLAFKGNTDDVRKSPAIGIIKQLQQEGARINAYDPKAMENMKLELPELNYFSDSYSAIKNSDAILILTDWDEFKKLDFEKISKLVKQPIILDTRNILDLDYIKSLNFVIDTIGRSCLAKKDNNSFLTKSEQIKIRYSK